MPYRQLSTQTCMRRKKAAPRSSTHTSLSSCRARAGKFASALTSLCRRRARAQLRRPSKRRKIAVQKFFVGDRVELTLDPLEGVVTKTGSGWVTVKFEWGVDNFRADELTRL